MDYIEVIERVRVLQSSLANVDGLSSEYPLSVETDGYEWSVRFFGLALLTEEEYDGELEEEIKEKLKEIQTYLNLVLGIEVDET